MNSLRRSSTTAGCASCVTGRRAVAASTRSLIACGQTTLDESFRVAAGSRATCTTIRRRARAACGQPAEVPADAAEIRRARRFAAWALARRVMLVRRVIW
jgi:hypothetical protein